MTDDVFVPSFEDVAPEEPVCEEVGCASEPVETAEPAAESAEPVEAETPATDDTAVEKPRSATRSPLCLPRSWRAVSMHWMRGLLN